MDKKGDISMGTIVVLVIALIVLVTVVLFFTGGAKSLTAKFTGFTGGATNNTASAGQSAGDYIKTGTW